MQELVPQNKLESFLVGLGYVTLGSYWKGFVCLIFIAIFIALVIIYLGFQHTLVLEPFDICFNRNS